ncbi:MAG: DUF4142 domain-containing protein [Janthinobacterium lividum]
MKKLLFTMALAAGIFAAKPSSAQTDNTASAGTAYSTIANDTVATNFIAQATLGSMKEIEAGKLAEKKGAKSSIKTYGARMIKDHTKAIADMKKILMAKKFTVAPPAAADAAPDAMLTDASGTKFDTNYVTMMVQDHVKTVKLFQNAADNVKDPDLKAFAVKTLPVLQEHLAMIKSIAKELNISTSESR